MEQSRHEACELVEEIRIDGGGVTPEDIDFLKKQRPTLLKSVMSLQQQLADAAKLLADELNTKDTHFIYELIQNAADNEYPEGVEPFLEFTLGNNYITVDSNEVGFSKEHIEAISRIGMSTKKNKIGFIGEKGIGFKSVFRVARKVHIQSEPYSFAFIYDEGDTGLGMATPLIEAYLDIPHGVQTRMILHLRESFTGAQLRSDFLKFPATSLLFLRKLKRITLNIEVSEHPSQRVTYTSEQLDGLRTNRRFVIRKDDGDSLSESIYWLKTHLVREMPSHPARKDKSQAEVILAFPLDGEGVPVLESQWISAFLPMRMENFKFLIQSDFITGANREDVRECAWNDRLRLAVAEAFVSTIKDEDGFLSHPTLRYSWVRYIPTASVAHEYWGRLQQSLVQKVKMRKLFLSRQHDDVEGNHHDNEDRIKRWTPEQLRIVTEQYRDEKNDPLLPDLVEGMTAYISEKYDRTLDLPVMRKLGTIDLCISPDFLDRLDQDLDRDEESIWRTLPFSSDWYTPVSHLLLAALEHPSEKERIQRLKIIPLTNKNWATSISGSIFLPTSGGINVPQGLELGIVVEEASANETFNTLLGKFGIKECEPNLIISLIEQRYVPGKKVTAQELVQDIEFLFWHNKAVSTSGYKIYLSCDDGIEQVLGNVAEGGWLYLPDMDTRYSMYRLLNGTIPAELKGQIKFPWIQYFNALKELGLRHDKTGPEWLMSRADIMVTPKLRRRTKSSLFSNRKVEMSAELLYLLEYLPQYLLGVLESDWINYPRSGFDMTHWDKVIKSAKVPILNAEEERELQSAFLPLPSLKKIANQLNLSEDFGFLEELDDMTEVQAAKWDFLKRFGVGMRDDLRFWIALLRKAQAKADIRKEHVFEIYRHLQKFVDKEDVEALRGAFGNENLIYAPSSTSVGAWRWHQVELCVWKAPKWFSFRVSLNNLVDYQPLYGLFVRTLRIKDVDIEDCLDYLKHIKQTQCHAENEEEDMPVDLLYHKLGELIEAENDSDAVKDKIRSTMVEEELVYDPKEGYWYSPADCIWAEDRVHLPGKLSVATTYKEHASFFINVLGVKKPNLGMHIAALITKSSVSNPNKESILQEMKNICALNPERKVLQEKLRDCACFPIRKPSGGIEWLSSASRFAIVDRIEYGAMFGGIVKTLDFSLEEVHSVRVLLIGLNLEKRFLSSAVEEETGVEDSTVDVVLTENLRRKAYAITRYAVHLGAPNPTDIFRLLQGLEVFTSDSIVRTVSVFKKPISDKAFFHMEKDDRLKLYVPKNREQQQVCLVRHLPRKLLELLGATVRGKGSELGGIITASSLIVVDTILEQDGVIEIRGIARPEDTGDTSLALLQTQSDEPVTASSTMRSSAHPEVIYQVQDSAYAEDSSWALPRFASYTPSESITLPEQPELFKELIDFVIHQSNHIDALPSFGTLVEASQAAGHSFDHRLAVESHIPWSGRRKIGAVGELLVFRLLKGLALPGFDISCWQSTIRHLVSVHSRYSNVTQWVGKETADIVYADKESQLTDLLIRSGYLARSSWHQRTPTYYIEIKTTMGDVNHPFFCTQGQFERMEEMQLSDSDQSSNEVYLIARVFGLGRSRMGLKLYLDPWNLRKTHRLKFEADLYTVTPL